MTSGSLLTFREGWEPGATTTISSILALCFAGEGVTANKLHSQELQVSWPPRLTKTVVSTVIKKSISIRKNANCSYPAVGAGKGEMNHEGPLFST